MINHIKKTVDERFREIKAQCLQVCSFFPEDERFTTQLKNVLLASNFAYSQWFARPKNLITLYESNDFNRLANRSRLSTLLQQRFESCHDINTLKQQLRHFYHYQLIRIIWHDINQLADLKTIMFNISILADVCIIQTLDFLQPYLEHDYGIPVDKKGNRQQLQVMAMGKLGANELNLSSDIDLIFCYPEEGKLNDTLDNQQFFTRLVQQFIDVLQDLTADGFAYRVDTRLRPYGLSGAIVMSLNALVDYYQNEARDWERYAMIKVRMVYGDHEVNQRLKTILRKFTYSLYIDFSVMESLRNLKKIITKVVNSKNMTNNIKLGKGGIREIEFIAQLFQLIHGGHDYTLQVPNLLTALKHLEQKSYIKNTTELRNAYVFLRILEHHLQAMDNQQTHSFPEDIEIQQRIALSLNIDSRQQLLLKLDHYRQIVSDYFAKVIEKPNSAMFSPKKITPSAVYNSNTFKKTAIDWQQRFQEKELNALDKNRLLHFIAEVQKIAANYNKAETTLDRVFSIAESLLQNSEYFLVFEENPTTLLTLVALCHASAWISKQIMLHPVLLAEMLNEERLYLIPDAAHMQQSLAEQLEQIDFQHDDDVLTIFRHFRQRQVFHIAASDVMGKLDIMRVSDGLTNIAIAVLRGALAQAWEKMTDKYGYPQRDDGNPCAMDFIIIAYGKLGGIELSYESDLDLVFVHDANEQALTIRTDQFNFDAISGAQFYTRLTKELLHILSAQTSSGKLYTIDTRLRPNGLSGLPVPSFTAFAKYQQESAWTWEHQALVRARVVAGDKTLAEKFVQLRDRILSQQRDIKKLKKEVISMHKRVTQADKKQARDIFNLKKSRGGMMDIEFIAQYLVLAWSHKIPELLMFTDNIRIFETCESAGLIPRRQIDQLCNAYRDLRRTSHRLALQYLPEQVPKTEFIALRKHVRNSWKQLIQS
ncbi:MAG: bifunctional [glutamate--ammonia ligase]-adenylyl-L-tyrosine phosphorylase/[glutamate--ammonia-ligase] adenylyltransferase [Pseudomonadota bacterium]